MCNYDLHAYLTGAALVSWAVILVNYNGVFDIDHDSVLEKNIPHKAVAGSPPGLDSDAILSPGEGNRFNCHILYTSFFEIFPQAPNAAKSNSTVHTYRTIENNNIVAFPYFERKMTLFHVLVHMQCFQSTSLWFLDLWRYNHLLFEYWS